MIVYNVPQSFATCLATVLFILFVPSAIAIKCFQCSSEKDGKGVDNCGAYSSFDKQQNIAVECMGEEAVTPGTFCFKSIQQSPRGFIWDGRWRSVIRRCAQVSERGISWGCDWGFYENGVYWEECYCAEDSCNHAMPLNVGSFNSIIFSLLIVQFIYWTIGH
ncbi:hypothetical protein RDWZM_008047 [Blomia tropicalis]|uniref:Protein sleepless n=1 Tax=Blomia tropicalis TaxID=40697 RepID=A0A9Q0M3S5_BLOTA|nr:hypothetical protein RDWZM_008047 [Blomia tropicalis]